MSGIAILMRRRLMTVWLWVGLFVAAVVWDFVDHQLTVRAMMQPIRFAAMDSRDTFYLSSVGSFDTSQHIHAEVARLAAETIFNRNPEGYDDPDRLERLFNPATTKSLQNQLEKDADAFRAQQIHQKFESGTIRELRVDQTTGARQCRRTGVPPCAFQWKFRGRVKAGDGFPGVNCQQRHGAQRPLSARGNGL